MTIKTRVLTVLSSIIIALIACSCTAEQNSRLNHNVVIKGKELGNIITDGDGSVEEVLLDTPKLKIHIESRNGNLLSFSLSTDGYVKVVNFDEKGNILTSIETATNGDLLMIGEKDVLKVKNRYEVKEIKFPIP